MPQLVQSHPSVIALPKDLETTSQIAREVREDIRDRVGAALAGVEICLNTISSPTSMDEGPFDDYSDDRLKSMS